MRAISESRGEPVDMAIAGEFASLLPLLNQQPYIRRAFAIDHWGLTPPQEWRAPIGELKGTDWDEQIDLGYRGWPDQALPYAIAAQAGVTIDLERPWITSYPITPVEDTTIQYLPTGFTEAWFELKFGLLALLRERAIRLCYITMAAAGSRWTTSGARFSPVSWQIAACLLQKYGVFFGDCSALHVLACAVGARVLIMEPMEARWNPIFYPYGMDGPRVTVVKGTDGRPTFDVHHCAEAIQALLQTTKESAPCVS